MKVTAIKLARVIALFDTNELQPTGTVPMSKMAAALVKKFEFQKQSESGSKPDEQNGFVFQDGVWSGIPVEKLTVYNDGLILDTRASTLQSHQILREALVWGKEKLGLHFDEEMLGNLRYLSTFLFQSDAPLLTHSDPINNAARKMAEVRRSITGSVRPYQGIRIDINFDQREHTEPIAAFTIQRLATAPFRSNRYFTQAPVPTDMHIEIVKQFETDTLASKR